MASLHESPRSGYMPSSRQSRMAIDSLLNPPSVEAERPTPRLHYIRASPQQFSPLYPPSPSSQYFYAPYSDGHRSYWESSVETPHDQTFLPYRPRSAESSPGAYARERYDSVSSSSSNAPERRRPPRPKYEEEEMCFIWYHRVDLSQEWKEVRESFNRQFPSRQRRGFQGIQCKFYRYIKEKGCPTLRTQRRMRDGEYLREGSGLSDVIAGTGGGKPQYGVVDWVGAWYPWMRETKPEVMTRHRVSVERRLGN